MKDKYLKLEHPSPLGRAVVVTVHVVAVAGCQNTPLLRLSLYMVVAVAVIRAEVTVCGNAGHMHNLFVNMVNKH